MSRNLKRTLLIIAIVSAAPFLATAAAREKIMEVVGLTSAASQDDAAQHVPNPGRNRPLQFNFRRY